MNWRPAPEKVPLTPYDLKLLDKLMSSPLLEDVMQEIREMADRKDRGDFEQETLPLVDDQ